MRGGGVGDLVALVAERASEEGRCATALPGLWLFRYDRPQPARKARSSALWVGVAVQGRKRMWVGGRELDYHRLSYLVVRGETEYEAAPIEASPEAPYLALGLHLPPDLVVRTLLELADEASSPGADDDAPAFVSPLDEHLVDALCQLLRTVDDPVERRVLAPLVIREIVFRLLRTDAAAVLRQVASRQNGERERIRDAMVFIETNAHRKLTVESIARRVAMSPSHFAHRFRDVASVSPMRYQKHVRLERARELLLEGRASAGDVATRVGYSTTSHFTRDFKRHYGLAPASYARAFERGGIVRVAAEGADD